MEKLKIDKPIIVEGRYDKNKLSSFIDGVIIVTDGFSVYGDDELKDYIRKCAKETGIIILTDSDSAGFRIRGYIKGLCPEGEIINVYTPDIFGKEKRKDVPSKEGKLGVEGIDINTLRQAFERAGVLGGSRKTAGLTKLDLYEAGLTGRPDSAARRQALYKKLSLPSRTTPNALLGILNAGYTREEFENMVNSLPD
ncbi:MAG: DUF4093 domain-containing protein [Ruminococcus sp.]|nr:DUF4093 domain-containing protein [Ruminococcus sp.]